MSNLLIKLPSRERFARFFQVLNAAQHNRELTTTRFLITLDTNDAIMNSEKARKVLDMWGNVTYLYGESSCKVDAINRDMDKAGDDWQYLLLLSDDMMPQVKGYDRIICEAFEKHFPDGDGVLWMNDGHVGKRLNTIVCVDRKYYERDNFIYNPVFKSLFCDNEFTDLSIKRGRVHYIDQVLIEHRHPMNVKGIISDNLYKRNDAYFWQDRKTYFYRKGKQLQGA